MVSMDIFNNDAFNTVSMLPAIEKAPYVPQLLGSLGIFDPNPVRTTNVMIEERSGTLALVPFTERGAPPTPSGRAGRNMRNFPTFRLAKQDVIQASEVHNIRAFGTESELQSVMAEVAQRYAGPTGLLNQIELTKENLRLAAIQGKVIDADGTVVLNYFTAFGVAEPTEIDFDLDNGSPASGAVRKKCTEVARAMQRAAAGAWAPTTSIIGLCGDAFWDDLTAHAEVRQTYLNTQEAMQLREGLAFERFNYGGITWINYRGTDDGTTVAVGTDKARFIPVGAPGVFREGMAPGESIDVVNTLGKPLYPMIVPDMQRQMFVNVELYAYPLFICTRPLMLQRARRT